MRNRADAIQAARSLAEASSQGMEWTQGQPWDRGYWRAHPAAELSRICSRATAALEFLRNFAGPDSYWTTRAVATYESQGDGQSIESGARGVADILLEWADGVEAGWTQIASEAASAEIVVSTGIMDQVRVLLEDKAMHPAAPIMLCGTAIEVALRATVDARNLPIVGRPGIASYAAALRTSGLFTTQDVKDVTALAGLRNSAAHGEFESLSAERAGVMEQQTNLMLRRIEELNGSAAPDV